MKALRNPVALSIILLLQACSSQPSPSSVQPAHVTLDSETPTPTQTFMLRGEVVLGHEVRSLTPCGSNQQYWLDLSNDRFAQGMKLVRSPYSPLYGEIVGHLEPTGQQGFAANYAAKFVVESINLLSAENPKRCQQALKPTRAFGNEPSWSAHFESDQLVFQRMGFEAQSFTVERKRLEQTRRRYSWQDGSLELNQRSCVDGMSDSLYGWASTLTIGDKQYQGCATLANQDNTQHWVDDYHAASTKAQHFTVTMALNPDHTAMTTYAYNNGDGDSVEHGFWQQINPDQVQVVMTHLQQQPLLSERIFTRDGHQLNAKKERVGDVIYAINDGGLTLYKAKVALTQTGTQSGAEGSSLTRLPQGDDIPSSAQFDAEVDKALRDYFAMHNTDPNGTKYRWLTYDLNGDGQPELLAQLDWCGSGGCTLLIFEQHQQAWRFNSKITLVQTPFNLGTQAHGEWQDLVMFVSGGGAVPNQHVLRHNGISYPLNPSVEPVANYDELSPVQLFSDGVTPHQEGLILK